MLTLLGDQLRTGIKNYNNFRIKCLFNITIGKAMILYFAEAAFIHYIVFKNGLESILYAERQYSIFNTLCENISVQ